MKAQLEKHKSQMEADNADMANELKTVSGSKAENERRRKQLEMQVRRSLFPIYPKLRQNSGRGSSLLEIRMVL